MNPFNYNQPDSRDILSRLIEMLSPTMNKQEETFLRRLSAGTYEEDLTYLLNALNGITKPLYIDYRIIENAAECYKQANKSMLNFRELTDFEKMRESSEIDFEASRLKDNWCDKLRQKGIQIIYPQPWQP